MREMNKQEVELIKNLFSCTQSTLKRAMGQYLRDLYGKDNVIEEKEYIVALGDIPIGLVAHMDTVHREPVKDLFYDKESNVMWSPQGIGADDRAGIYAIMELLGRDYKPTVILTTDEEIGGIGAAALVSDYGKSPCPMNFIIELDRRGENDSVFYSCDNKLFEDYINFFGFVSNWGSFSDISYIAPAWGIAAVNLSIGYENEHTLAEYLNVSHMFATIDKVGTILENVCKDDYFEYIEEENKIWFRGAEATVSINDGICWGCLDIFNNELLIEYENEHYCGDCYAKLFATCSICEEPFPHNGQLYIECEHCRKY